MSDKNKDRYPLNILYAGNIGVEGLELIVIPLAIHFKQNIIIHLIGDGSSIKLLKKK